MEEQDIYERVLRVNNDLRSLGHTWEEVENFWKECFKKSKEQVNS